MFLNFEKKWKSNAHETAMSTAVFELAATNPARAVCLRTPHQLTTGPTSKLTNAAPVCLDDGCWMYVPCKMHEGNLQYVVFFLVEPQSSATLTLRPSP